MLASRLTTKLPSDPAIIYPIKNPPGVHRGGLIENQLIIFGTIRAAKKQTQLTTVQGPRMKTNNRLRAILIIASFAALTGCATPVYNYRPTIVEVSEPPLDLVSVAHVGDVLLRQGKYSEQDAILLSEDFTVGLTSPYTLMRGHYIKQGDDAETEFYIPSSKDGGRIEKNLFSDPPKIVQAYKTLKKLCVITVLNGVVCSEGAQFSRTKQPIESVDSFQQALIYSGRVGNRVRIGYREFSTSLARPAFNNEAEYDLNDSKTIGYKNARLEILDATNESIRYRVLSNFNTRKP
jgi:hypothetical protein